MLNIWIKSENHSNYLRKLKKFFENYFIFFILIFAFIIRLKGIDWGLPYAYHPDEKVKYVETVVRMLVEGDLNPRIGFETPGSFVMYLLAALYLIYFLFCFVLGYIQNLGDVHQFFLINQISFYLIGRFLIVIFSIISLYLVYLIAKRLFNKTVGLLSSFVLMLSPIYSHYSWVIRPDIPSVLLILLSLFFLLKFFDRNKSTRFLLLSSFFAGASITTRYTSAVIVLPILLYCVIKDLNQKLPAVKYLINLLKIKAFLSKAVLFMFIGFFVFAPFVVLDFKEAFNLISWQVEGNQIDDITCVGHDKISALQSYVYYLKGTLKRDVGGLFFELFAGLGLFVVSYWAISKKSFRRFLFLIFPLVFFLSVGAMTKKTDRWLIPLLAFEAVFFGVGYYHCYKFVKRSGLKYFRPKHFSFFRILVVFLFIFMLVFASVPAVNKVIRQTRADTRNIAKDWIEANLPSGSKIAYEGHGPQLHVQPMGNFTLMPLGYEFPFASKPLSYYKDMSVEYIVLTSIYKNNCYNNPQKHLKAIAQYEELQNSAKLVKKFDNKKTPGLSIEIYKLN